MKRQTRGEQKAFRRAIRSEKRKEQALSMKNEYGFKDLTPYNTVRDMRGEGIVYKDYQG